MKIVFLDTTMDGAIIGGAHTFLPKILNGLNRRNVEIHLVTKGRPSEKLAQGLKDSGAIIHNKLWPEYSLVEDATPILADWLNKLKADVFVISASGDIGWTVLPYLSPNIATVAIGHNDSDTFYEPARYYSGFLSLAIGVSEEICRSYVHKSDISEKNVVWIPYGVESHPPDFNRQVLAGTQKISLVYVGRLVEEQKRSSDLIKIIQLLTKRTIPFQFRIIGDGPLYSRFQEELAAAIASGDVQMTGWLTNEELMTHLHHSDIFILTSSYEGFCISLVEAMANGCCAIVTDIKSGNKQLVTNEQNGYVVPVGDIESFIKSIAYLAANPSTLLELRRKSYEVGRSYSVERMVENYIDCFAKLIDSVKKGSRQSDPSFPLMPSCRSRYPRWLRRTKVFARRITSSIHL